MAYAHETADLLASTTERADDIPLLLAHLRHMRLPELLDAHIGASGDGQRLSYGWLAALWLTHILSQSDAKPRSLQHWAAARPETLSWCIGQGVQPGDLYEPRLRDLLRQLGDDSRWRAFETELNRGLLRGYAVAADQVRIHEVEQTSWQVLPEGVLYISKHRGWRPGVLRLHVILAALDPSGLPLTTWAKPSRGAASEKIADIVGYAQACLERSDTLYVGQELGHLEARAAVHAGQGRYLCPLPEALNGDRLAPRNGARQLHLADAGAGERATTSGYEWQEPLAAEVAGRVVRWAERRLLVRSTDQLRLAEEELRVRLARACASLEALGERKRGKRRPRTLAALQLAVQEILDAYEVRGLLQIEYDEEVEERMVRRYRGRPTSLRVERDVQVRATVDEQALGSLVAQLGWQAYATNMPPEALPIAHLPEPQSAAPGFERLSGRPLSLTPGSLQRDELAVGLVRLLSLALRSLVLLEITALQRLAVEDEEQPGQVERRRVALHAGERLLETFRDIVLYTGQPREKGSLTALTPLQYRLLNLLKLPPDIYRYAL
jgi:hypothetical protein